MITDILPTTFIFAVYGIHYPDQGHCVYQIKRDIGGNTPYEGLKWANQKSRKVGVLGQKFEGIIMFK